MPTFVVTIEKDNNKLKTVCPVARSDFDCPSVREQSRTPFTVEHMASVSSTAGLDLSARIHSENKSMTLVESLNGLSVQEML